MPTGERIHGPYPHRNAWRVVVVTPSGRSTQSCSTREEALALIATLRAKAGARTVEQVISSYVQYLTVKGNRPRSVETTEQRLRALTAGVATLPIQELTARRAGQLYRSYAQGRSPDTHRNTLGQARTWGKWVKRRGWSKVNPWEEVEPFGRRSAGKPQLMPDEARRFAAVALDRAREGDGGALAVLLALCLGLRASEVVGLTRREVNA